MVIYKVKVKDDWIIYENECQLNHKDTLGFM